MMVSKKNALLCLLVLCACTPMRMRLDSTLQSVQPFVIDGQVSLSNMSLTVGPYVVTNAKHGLWSTGMSIRSDTASLSRNNFSYQFTISQSNRPPTKVDCEVHASTWGVTLSQSKHSQSSVGKKNVQLTCSAGNQSTWLQTTGEAGTVGAFAVRATHETQSWAKTPEPTGFYFYRGAEVMGAVQTINQAHVWLAPTRNETDRTTLVTAAVVLHMFSPYLEQDEQMN